MKKLTIFVLVLLCALSGVTSAVALIHESAGATYTFIGGSWTDKNSWEPATAGNGPGLDDNVVIPEGGNAVMPKSCDIGTLTVRGKLTMGNDLRLNSMTVETGGVFELGADLTCTGMLKNNGQIKGGDIFLKCQNFENSAFFIATGKVQVVAVFNIKNLGTLKAGPLLMLRSNNFTNDGLLETTAKPGTVAVFINNNLANNGSIRASAGKSGSNGGAIFVACSSFEGTGKVYPGDGGNGNPPGKKGVALIGSSFDQTGWTNWEPTAPKGNPPQNLTAWNAQVVQAKDGKSSISTGNLKIVPPTTSKPDSDGFYTHICDVSGGTYNFTLAWSGQGIAHIKGSTSNGWALNVPVNTMLEGERCSARVTIPPSSEGVKTLTISYAVLKSNFRATLTVLVYFVRHPVITFKTGQRIAQVENQNRVSSKQYMHVAPYKTGNCVMVPLRFFVETCNGSVSWDAKTRTAKVSMPGRKLGFSKNSANSTINGHQQKLASKCTIIAGRIMVPVSDLADMSGASSKLLKNGEMSFKYPA